MPTQMANSRNLLKEKSIFSERSHENGKESSISRRMSYSDRLFYKGNTFFINHSPIAVLDGYEQLFRYPGNYLPNTRWGLTAYPNQVLEPYGDHDKHYRCYWTICDDKLLLLAVKLYDVQIHEWRLNEEKESQEIARFTKGVWSHEWDHFKAETTYTHIGNNTTWKEVITPSESGALWAEWFTGTIDMASTKQFEKIFPASIKLLYEKIDMETTSIKKQNKLQKQIDKLWKDKYKLKEEMPFTRLTFKKGKLVKQETIKPKKIK